MEKVMGLTNRVLSLRPYGSEDVDLLYEAARESINEIYPWMKWCHPHYSREDSIAWVRLQAEERARQSEYSFVIVDAKDGRFLGSCGINQINRTHDFANLGYWVRSSETRRGVATEATKLLAEFGFGELKLNRIELVIAVGNRASERVAEKVGATREGILRRRLLIGDKTHDAVMYSLIPEDILVW